MATWSLVFAVAAAGPETAVSLAGVVETALAVSVVLVPTVIGVASMPTVRVVLVAAMAGEVQEGQRRWTGLLPAMSHHFQGKPIDKNPHLSHLGMAELDRISATSAARGPAV